MRYCIILHLFPSNQNSLVSQGTLKGFFFLFPWGGGPFIDHPQNSETYFSFFWKVSVAQIILEYVSCWLIPNAIKSICHHIWHRPLFIKYQIYSGQGPNKNVKLWLLSSPSSHSWQWVGARLGVGGGELISSNYGQLINSLHFPKERKTRNL